MKKEYIDELLLKAPEGEAGEIQCMYHMRRVPSKTAATANHWKISVVQLYNRLYQGRSVAFDLTIKNISFAMSKIMTIATREEFIRRIASKYTG
jgi:hypothetical protein